LFQTHHFSENLVVPRIEPGNFGYIVRNSDHQTIQEVLFGPKREVIGDRKSA
jgi:hypothetical protein